MKSLPVLLRKFDYKLETEMILGILNIKDSVFPKDVFITHGQKTSR
jgi:hypothetical protein